MGRMRPSKRMNAGYSKRAHPVKVRNTFQWPQEAMEYERQLGLAELRANGLVKKYVPSAYRAKIKRAIECGEEGIYKALRSQFGRQSVLKK
jgi:hypothetical protein